MAQRKSPPAKSAGAKATSVSKAGAGKGASSKPTGRPPAKATGRPPARKPGKSIVNQKQTPWGLIATTAAIVAFAVAVVVIVVVTHKDKTGSNDQTSVSHGGQSVDASDPYRQPELAAAKKIKGITYTVEAEHTHVQGHIKYDSSPPVGGNHSDYWADCTGTVYSKPIANENGVHMLEHGAVWITYNAKTLPAAQLATLKKLVAGQDHMALSPYPDLSSPVSLQAWGYQLFANSASDPRVKQFINTLKYNQNTTPETGATCSQPTFKAKPSTFGHPKWLTDDGKITG